MLTYFDSQYDSYNFKKTIKITYVGMRFVELFLYTILKNSSYICVHLSILQFVSSIISFQLKGGRYIEDIDEFLGKLRYQ